MTARAREIDGTDDARFRTIFEQSPISMQIFSPDGETIAVNHAWEELWGVTLERIGGYNILQDDQLVVKGVMPYIEKGFRGTRAAIPAIKYEPEQTIPGRGAVPYRWVRAAIYPVTDENGAIREVVLMHEDITEQRDAEEALRESEARFRAVFEGAPVGISLVDSAGHYLAVNPARQAMLGYTEEELLGRHYSEVLHPDAVAHDAEVNEEAQQQGRDRFQFETRFLHKDGAVRWTRMTISQVADTPDGAGYSVSIAEDITEQRQAERERARLFDLERDARARAERLAAEQEAILRQVAEGIIITDPDGLIIFVNAAAQTIHGVAELGVPVDRYTEVYGLYTMDGEPYPSDQLPLARAVRGEPSATEMWRIRRPDGSEVIAQGDATPVIGPDGARLGAVLTVRDVTAQHEMELQKERFLSAVAHDLRTPLTTIKGRVQMLERRARRGQFDQDSVAESLRRIDGGVTRMITLINELLDMANMEIGRPFRLSPRSTDLVALAAAAAREYQQVTSECRIEIQAPDAEVVGAWDPDRLDRVLANLLSNALKYSPDGTVVTVEVRRDGDWATLAVRDRGIGIPAADLPHIFDRFHRAGNVAGRIPGTGIGLAAVRQIVEQHGGSITAESVEGQGSCFTVRLPLNPQAAAPPPAH